MWRTLGSSMHFFLFLAFFCSFPRAACSQRIALACSGDGMPGRRGRLLKRSAFAWSAGGLDLQATSLGELQLTPVPEETVSGNLRDYLEGLGYTVRTKMSRIEMSKLRRNSAASSSDASRGLQPEEAKQVRKRGGLQPGAKQKRPHRLQLRAMKDKLKRSGLQPGAKASAKQRWICLKQPELEALYKRHKRAIECANERLTSEKEHARNSTAAEAPPEDAAIYWWVDESGSDKLSDNNEMGLKTAVTIGGLQPVKLYSYARPSNLPTGCDWCSAEEVMTREEWTEKRSHGSKPANVADVGRLRAVVKEQATGLKNMWMCDLDLHWFGRARPAACSQGQGAQDFHELPAAAFEHVIGTMQNRPGCQAGKEAEIKKKMSQFLQRPFDSLTAVPPLRFTARSPLPKRLLEMTEQRLAARPNDYIAGSVMGCLAECVLECGLMGAYQPPAAFSMVPYYSGARPIVESSVSGITITGLLSQAWGQNSYWQSGKTSTETLCERGSHAKVAPGSLYHAQTQMITAFLRFPTPGGLRCLAETAAGSSARPAADTLRRLTWLAQPASSAEGGLQPGVKGQPAAKRKGQPADSARSHEGGLQPSLTHQSSEEQRAEAACSQSGPRFFSKQRDPAAPVLNPLPWSRLEFPPENIGGGTAGFALSRLEFSTRKRSSDGNYLEDLGYTLHANDLWMSSPIRQSVELIRKLGDGTFGNVYTGKYLGEKLRVAVKVSRSDRLHKTIDPVEVALLARCQGHPNVVKLRDYWYTPYWTVIVMAQHDFDLFHCLLACPQGGLHPVVALDVTRQVLQGVGHLHSHNTLHRDLHAGNVLISLRSGPQPGEEIVHGSIAAVCVTDLGSGCDTHGDKPNIQRSNSLGAEVIRAPELWLARREPRYDKPIDIWATGVLFVQMIKGSNFLRKFRSREDFLKFWEAHLGPLEQRLATKNDWYCRGSPSSRPAAKHMQPLKGCTLVTEHLDILKWDPVSRYSSQNLARRFASKVDLFLGNRAACSQWEGAGDRPETVQCFERPAL